MSREGGATMRSLPLVAQATVTPRPVNITQLTFLQVIGCQSSTCSADTKLQV